MVYLIGNNPVYSEVIMKRLGIDTGKAIPLNQYQYNQNGSDKPIILVTSSGFHHGDTLNLSEILLKNGVYVDAKIVIDRHLDFERPGVDVPKFDISDHSMQMRKDNLYNKSVTYYASHSRELCGQEYLDSGIGQMFLLGVENENPMLTIKSRLSNEPSLRYIFKDQIFSSPRIDVLEKIEGKKIHLSIDIDAIPDLNCLGMDHWSGKTGPSLSYLLSELKGLAKNNEIVALDLAGYYPNIDDITAADKQGMNIYDQLIKQVI